MAGSPIDVTADEYRGGEGPPLVLIHGGFACWQHWETTIPLLNSQFDVLAPAMPGHLGGPALSGPVTAALLADGVEAAMDRAGFDTAHIVGNSVGGWVAAELARRGRARSLVLLSPAGGWKNPERRMHRTFKLQDLQLRLLRRLLPLILAVPFLRKVAFHGMAMHGDRLTRDAALRITQGALGADIGNLTHLKDIRMDPLPDPGVPVLLAWSERDRLLTIPKYSDPWREASPYAEWRVLPGLGHLPMVDDPGLVAGLVTEWALAAEAGTGPAA